MIKKLHDHQQGVIYLATMKSNKVIIKQTNKYLHAARESIPNNDGTKTIVECDVIKEGGL